MTDDDKAFLTEMDVITRLQVHDLKFEEKYLEDSPTILRNRILAILVSLAIKKGDPAKFDVDKETLKLTPLNKCAEGMLQRYEALILERELSRA